MTGDGDIGGRSVDKMVSIGVNGVVGTLEQVACHLESQTQLGIDVGDECVDCCCMLREEKTRQVRLGK